jgi:hypothetical protein
MATSSSAPQALPPQAVVAQEVGGTWLGFLANFRSRFAPANRSLTGSSAWDGGTG